MHIAESIVKALMVLLLHDHRFNDGVTDLSFLWNFGIVKAAVDEFMDSLNPCLLKQLMGVDELRFQISRSVRLEFFC